MGLCSYCGCKNILRNLVLQHSTFLDLPSWHRLIDAAQSLYRDMIAWIGSCLVQESDGLTVECHVLSFESQVSDPSYILLAVTVIVFKEQVHRSGRVPQSSVQRDLGHIIGARKLDFLRRGKVSCRPEVKIVTIAKEFERPWR
jgi:hypothetical protein